MQIDLVLGDAFKLMPEIPDNSFDLIYVDPPYIIRTGVTFIELQSMEI